MNPTIEIQETAQAEVTIRATAAPPVGEVKVRRHARYRSITPVGKNIHQFHIARIREV